MGRIVGDKVYRMEKKEREMGVEMLEVGAQIKKVAIFSIRACYRSVLNHPFLVGMVLFLFFMHRSFPFLFSLFVSASPVLVCTAVLLGTLLSFGQPNIPEIEKEEMTNHEIMSLKTGIQVDSTVVERGESFVVERHTAKRSDAVLDESIAEASSVASEDEKNDCSLVHSEPQIGESSREIQFEKRLSEGEERELHDSGLEIKTETKEEKVKDSVFLESQYTRIEEVEDENAEVHGGKSPAEFINTSPISTWKPVGEEEEGVDDIEDSESGSDGAESSSPDASMADIIPMLDELHPLLDEDVPQPAHMSHDGSDAGSELSQKSSDGTNESDDEESEHREEEVGDDDENDDEDEEEEETVGSKEEALKSAIKWTEDDQKNLMDLGTSELERNQRLENLIARRRARRIMAEKNLIDFESSDLPFNIPPISTIRHNPFDLPYDSNDNITGLPPIPGSAPSILLPRHNPFDIPYDPNEEKPDLKGDGFQQEFMSFVPKETFFRRHESFNVGPSFFGPPKHEKQDIKFSPFFVPERLGSEGTSYSSLHRQSSELSDSKASSVPETESVCSDGDHDDKKLIEEDLSQDADLISDAGHPSEHIGHGSVSSEDTEREELGQAEKSDIEHDEVEIEMEDEEIHSEMVSSFSDSRDVAIPGEHDMGTIHLNKRADEVNYSSRSNSSSSSEVHERIFDEKEEVSSSLRPTKEENVIDEPPLEESDINTTMELVAESQHKEPVYDSSPTAVHKNLSSSSNSSDSQVETSEVGFSPVMVKRVVSFDDSVTEVTDLGIGGHAPSNEQIFADSSNVDSVDENGMITSGVAEKAEHILLSHELSGADKQLDSGRESRVPEFATHIEDAAPVASYSENKSSEDLDLSALKKEQPSVVVYEPVFSGSPAASSYESEAVEELPLDKEVTVEIKQDQVHSSGPRANFHEGIDQEGYEELSSPDSECEEKPIYELKKQLPVSDKAMVESSSENREELVVPQVESVTDVNATSKLDTSEFQPKNDELTALADLDDNALDEVENPDHIPVQSFNFQMEASGSQIHDHDIIEEADEIKEIDEGLLMELDAVGDFSVEEFGSNLHKIENRVSGEEMNSEMPSVEARSIEEIDSNFEKTEPLAMKAEVEIREVEIPQQSQIKEEIIESGMPVFEARSTEDPDKAFRQMIDEEIKMPVVIESVYSKMVPEETRAGRSEYEISHEDSSLTETKMELPVVEATSIEDLDLAYKQLNSSSGSLVDVPDSIGSTDPVEIDSDLHVERQNKQNSLFERLDVLESDNVAETTSEPHFTEPRSVEDTDMTLKSDFEEPSGKNESIEVGSFEEIETGTKEHGIPETSTSGVEQPDHGVKNLMS
ncbi:hypothetical protein RHMOL_Rhmol03G0048700 [Rhododendron molle]|uniref:Uncharacterized protein n=2 Tax=Rhododendron molle TaxID=49168 RepID=A0ACC0PCY2_RHOML|nr:hypothetical protein RHMOL_Rhmol03G0048700 [Rhododendron molle]KAI8562618.1 hypothetical protein RHMOL_Rhmol03G0048700 [Rhododendron molle]